jgi:formate dehydrogenase subunit beta
MQGWLKVEDNAAETVNRLLEALLTGGIVDGLLVPLRTPDGRNVVPTLVRDPALLARAAPLAPVLPVNGGTVLGHVTATGGLGRVGAVLRNCELRAAFELSKVRQVLLDDVVLVGVDCLGTYGGPGGSRAGGRTRGPGRAAARYYLPSRLHHVRATHPRRR